MDIAMNVALVIAPLTSEMFKDLVSVIVFIKVI